MCVVCGADTYWVTLSGPEERQLFGQLRLHSHCFQLLAPPATVQVPGLGHLVMTNSINALMHYLMANSINVLVHSLIEKAPFMHWCIK